jgi:hypothetical protein
MLKKTIFIITLFCLVITFFTSVYAAVPAKVNFQGRLEESGRAVNASRNMIFKIYDAETSGTLIWTSQTNVVLVANGLFSVNLETGTVSNISTATFKGARYVEVSVDGVILSPRQEIIAAPYALVAQTLSDNGCTNNQILKWDSTGANWNCSDSEAASIVAGDYLNDIKVSSAIYSDTAGSVSVLASGDYLNDIKVSSAIYADSSAGLVTGNYFNDIKVSSAIYADNAETKVAKTGDSMSGALTLAGSSITVITADTMPSSLWVSTSVITPHLYVSTNGNTGIGLANPHSKLQVSGAIATALVNLDSSVITNYTVTNNDSVIIGNTTSAHIYITLPSAVGIKGRQYFMKNIGTNGFVISVYTTNSETIDGLNYPNSGDLEVSDWESVRLVSDGANWFILVWYY